MSGPYDRDQLGQTLIADWRGQDFSLFRYPPARYQNKADLHSTTRLVLDFKKAEPGALEEVGAWATEVIRTREAQFRDELDCRWLISIPGSGLDDRNEPCEWLGHDLAQGFEWMTNLPHAIRRVFAVPRSSSARSRDQRPSAEQHLASLRYEGPVLSAPAPDDRPYCPVHNKAFRRGGDGYRWHLEHFHGGRAPASGSVLLLDDVITHGSTSEACRELLIRDAGAPAVYGFFVGKTLRN